MKKIFIFLALFLCFFYLDSSAFSKTLSGGVTYSVEDARNIAFKNVQMKISMDPYQKYMTDPGFTPPKKPGGKPKIKRLWRSVTFFSDGSYGVSYFTQYNSYYYDKNGKLTSVEIGDTFSDYSITKTYLKNGEFFCLNFRQNYKGKDFVYNYDKNKKYLGKWIDNLYYNTSGKITDKRWN